MADTLTEDQSVDSDHRSHSPISQLLVSLGMTREELTRRSAQMREFLTTEHANSLRALVQNQDAPQSGQQSDRSEGSFSAAAKLPQADSRSRSMSNASVTQAPPPFTLSQHNESSTHPTSNSDASNPPKNRYVKRETVEKKRKGHEKLSNRPVLSSSPSRPRPSLDEIMQTRSRASRRVPESEDSESSSEDPSNDVFNSRPMQPRTSPYYRTETDSVGTRPESRSSADLPLAAPHYQHDASNATASGPYYRPIDCVGQAPVTPQYAPQEFPKSEQPPSSKSLSYYRKNYDASHVLPPSSSPATSSATSSPTKSSTYSAFSPSVMSSDPPDHADSEPPFTLPPGPYSTDKPDLSYAAMIGRAILASPSHSLRLKDIYDYVSTVWPYFQRQPGRSHSQKWMNAIRQNLTNTPQFQKLEVVGGGEGTRGGRWQIYDDDLLCFAGGVYNRHGSSPIAVQPAPRVEKKKRKPGEEQSSQTKSKKPRITPAPNPYHFPYAGSAQLTMYPMAGHPAYYFPTHVTYAPLPGAYPNSHFMQSSYNPSGAVLASAQSRHMSRAASEAKTSSTSSHAEPTSSQDDAGLGPTPPPPSSSSSCSLSMPELTPNCSSSPPEPDDESQADIDLDLDGDVPLASLANARQSDMIGSRSSPSPEDSLEPGLHLMDRVMRRDKGKGKQVDRQAGDRDKPQVSLRPPPMPTTPTTRRKPAKKAKAHKGHSKPATQRAPAMAELPPSRPSTPPRNATSLPFSSVRTPLQHKAAQTTPTRNAEPCKSSLHPVPDALFGGYQSYDDGEGGAAAARTPSRTRTTSAGAGAGTGLALPGLPVTPKLFASPFGSFSPFRTPSRRVVFDPHDPGALLDDELSRLSALDQAPGLQDSPVGFFGHGKGLLYESPSLPSPGQWGRPW